MPEYNLSESMEILNDLNFPNNQYMIMMDESAIILYDKKFSKIVFQYQNPRRMFHHFFHDCKRLNSNIIKVAQYINRFNNERNLSPLESIWPYKNLLKYYTTNQINIMFYGK